MTDNARGILAMLIGSTAFVMNDAMVKLVTAELPAGEIIVIRGVLSTALLAIGVVAMRAMRPIAVLLTPMMLMRLAAAAGATIFVVLTLRHLPLATVNCVVQFTPLAVTAGAALLYGERVGWQRWLAAFAGFIGVVLIVKPGGSFGVAAYLALTTLMFTTIRDLSTRAPSRYPFDLRRWGERSGHHAGRIPRRTDRRGLDHALGLGLGTPVRIRGVPVRRQHVSHRRLSNGRDLRGRPLPVRPRAAVHPARLVVLGRPSRRHRVSRHCPGAGCRPLHAAS